MKAVAVFPGKPNSTHLADLPEPKVDDVPGGHSVLVEVLRVGMDGTDKEIDDAEYGAAPETLASDLTAVYRRRHGDRDGTRNTEPRGRRRPGGGRAAFSGVVPTRSPHASARRHKTGLGRSER